MVGRTRARHALLAALAIGAALPRAGRCGEGPYSHFEAGVEKLVAEGDASYEAGLWALAIPPYLEAIELVALPDLLLRVATCYRNIGQPELAARYYRDYLAQIDETGEIDDADERVEAFQSAPEPAEEDEEMPEDVELEHVETDRASLDLVFVGFVSDPGWGPGHTMGTAVGLTLLRSRPVVLGLLAGYGYELGKPRAGAGSHAVVGQVRVSVLMPEILAGRILLALGASTMFRHPWRPGLPDPWILSIGPALEGRFRVREGIGFGVEVGASPVLVVGGTGRLSGVEVVVKGGLTFGL
jgi:tetratricopeptide (TPR) repeat protein